MHLTARFLVVFCTVVGGLLGITIVRLRRRPAPRNDALVSAWSSCLILLPIAALPCLSLAVLMTSSPEVSTRLLKLFLLVSLTPSLVLSIWILLPLTVYPKLNVRSVTVSLACYAVAAGVGVVGVNVVMGPPLKGTPSLNSPDLSYWYYQPNLATTVNGVGLRFNSWGFRGPEPRNSHDGLIKVLLIGDSIPFGGDQPETKIFPRLSEALINEQLGGTNVEIMNAAIPSFSMEQIKNLYLGRFGALTHDLVVLSFYLDDVNRELRYKKSDILYSPAWSEWIQDIYYSSYTGYMMMTLLGFRDANFLLFRKRSLNEAWPRALDAVEVIRREAERRGARLLVFNVPVFNWSDRISDEKEYRYVDWNKELQAWATRKQVAYWDTLPAFLGRDVDTLRNSSSDIHFNEAGHALMAEELKKFLTPLMKKTTPARRSSAPGAASRQAHTIELDAAAIATPFWIYDAAAIERQIEKLRAFDVIRYAQKANSNLSVPQVMRRNGVLVDAVLDGSWV